MILIVSARSWVGGILLPCALSLATSGLQAQGAARGGILRSRPELPASTAVSTCPALLGQSRYDLEAHFDSEPRLSVSCVVDKVDTLGEAGGVRLIAVRYLTREIFPADSTEFPHTKTDTAEVIDIVIYTARPAASVWRAEWRRWVERAFTWDLIPHVAPHGASALIGFMACVNGTGGCSQEFLLRQANGSWRAVAPAYVTTLVQHFGEAFWKGINVDVSTLRGNVPLYSDTDGNCCPSREVTISLSLVGSTLELKTFAVHAANPPDA
jgi:hypothetical protein